MIEDANNRKLASVVSCWDIAIKVGLGKLDLGQSSRSFLPREIARNHFELLPITLDHATLVEGLAAYHRDPFDRLLVAQAMAEGLPLVSADGVFDQYDVNRFVVGKRDGWLRSPFCRGAEGTRGQEQRLPTPISFA
jgi:PIN domain nuclease of toxin-antitoxin system